MKSNNGTNCGTPALLPDKWSNLWDNRYLRQTRLAGSSQTTPCLNSCATKLSPCRNFGNLSILKRLLELTVVTRCSLIKSRTSLLRVEHLLKRIRFLRGTILSSKEL